MAASASRGQIALFVGLMALLVAVVGYQARGWRGAPAARPVAGAPGTSGTAGPGGSDPPMAVPDVRLESLQAARPEPVSDRNLFREQPKAPPPPPPAASRPVVAAPVPDPNAPPPGPPPPPPITLKFIGVVQAGGRSVAVLRDGTDILYGREGELVDGRYRIIKINVESVEVSYADGRGRRVIPLIG
ncbi:MAG: hypothetical protein EHM24_10595 [Acidobacteria bacterium]|nr:MAG: hypothetical protein EHM24_10595 [Acidobacteriota bacterium]